MYMNIFADKLKLQYTVTTVVIQSVFMFVLTILCASLLYKYVEIPMSRIIKNKIND